MKYISIILSVPYAAHLVTPFIPSRAPSPFAVHRQLLHPKGASFILWQRSNVDSPFLETTETLVHADVSNTVRTARETRDEPRASEPEPTPHHFKTLETKRGGKLLAKEKDSAQFYEVRRMGLESSRSSAYDTVELKSNIKEDGASFPFDTLFSRTLDTIEDAVLHARRIPYDLGWVMEGNHGDDDRKTVVVLGRYWRR